MKEFSKKFYKSNRWQKSRKAYINQRIMIDGGLCEECKKELGYIVHHKIPLTPQNIDDYDITLNFQNLEYVCKSCHDLFEGHGVGKGNSPIIVLFDESGMPVARADTPPLK